MRKIVHHLVLSQKQHSERARLNGRKAYVMMMMGFILLYDKGLNWTYFARNLSN